MEVLHRVLAFSASWMIFGVVSGYIATHLSDRWFERDTRLTRLRRFEHRGRWYDRRLGVRRWKDRVPEAGDFFAGGRSKARLGGGSTATLVAFCTETRRAEWVHWANVGFGWTFFLWNEWTVGLAMVLFGTVVHVPFIIIQRYNRARLAHLLSRREATTPTPARETGPTTAPVTP